MKIPFSVYVEKIKKEVLTHPQMPALSTGITATGSWYCKFVAIILDNRDETEFNSEFCLLSSCETAHSSRHKSEIFENCTEALRWLVADVGAAMSIAVSSSWISFCDAELLSVDFLIWFSVLCDNIFILTVGYTSNESFLPSTSKIWQYSHRSSFLESTNEYLINSR